MGPRSIGDILKTIEGRLARQIASTPETSTTPTGPRDPASSRPPLVGAEIDPDACPKCLGAGWLRLDVPITDPRFGQTEVCGCLEERRKRKAWQDATAASGMAAEIRNHAFATFDRAKQPDAHDAAYSFAQLDGLPPKWLVLYGVTGSGKTHLLCAAANVLIADGSRPVYWSVPDFLAHLQDGYSDGSFANRLSAARECAVLLLDEWGAEKLTDDKHELLYRVVGNRMSEGRPTAIATNLRPDQFPPRFRSRLNDPDRVVGVKMRPYDYRTGETFGEPLRETRERREG